MERSDKKNYWFPAKKYGFGWGMPITWQGWIVFIAYIIAVLVSSLLLPARPLLYTTVVTIGTGILVLITVITGEPTRWRWGDSSSDK